MITLKLILKLLSFLQYLPEIHEILKLWKESQDKKCTCSEVKSNPFQVPNLPKINTVHPIPIPKQQPVLPYLNPIPTGPTAWQPLPGSKWTSQDEDTFQHILKGD